MLKIKPKIKNSKAIGLAIAGLTLVMVSTCTTPAFAVGQERIVEKNSIAPLTVEHVQLLESLELENYNYAINNEIALEELRINNKNSLQFKFTNKALQYENTGKWVFGGSTPSAWDCSGFIMYVARNSIDLELYHSATVQMNSGVLVDYPVIGDLVGLYYKESSEMSSHIGIYVGDGKFIHVSQKRGTVVSKILSYEDDYDVRYSRIIDKERNWDPVLIFEKKNYMTQNFFNTANY